MARHPELVMFLPRKDLADWQRDQDMYRTTAVSFRTYHWNVIWIIWLLYLDESAFAFFWQGVVMQKQFLFVGFQRWHHVWNSWQRWEPAGSQGRSSRSHSSRNTSHKPNPAVRKFLPECGDSGPCSCEYILTYFNIFLYLPNLLVDCHHVDSPPSLKQWPHLEALETFLRLEERHAWLVVEFHVFWWEISVYCEQWELNIVCGHLVGHLFEYM